MVYPDSLNKSEFEQFLTAATNPQGPQSHWSALGSDSWPRFVVHTRSSIWARYPRLHLISLDWIYVEWLKRLLDKRFSKVCTLVSDVHHLLGSSASELATLREQPQLRETFTRLCGPEMDVCAPWWLSSCIQVHTHICTALFKALSESPPVKIYVMPAVWRQPKIWPFEAYLRSRWGDKLPELLDCDVKELRWWHETQPTPIKSPQEPEERLVQPWLRPYCVEEGEGGPLWSDEGGFRSQLWKLLDSAMAPVWDRKFYRCKFAELTTNFTRYEDLRVCSWINNWLATFGLPFMGIVQNLVMDSTSDDEPARSRMAEYVTAIETLRSLPSALREADCETHSDFLVEPTLLLQVPVHPALLQQWLAAALLEVTRFEYHSMELRHWPLPASLASLASRLLNLVCRCKERLLLGVALLCRDVTTHPRPQRDTSPLLLDEVLIPAVQVLNFLVSREADSLLSEIKHQAWSSSREMSASLRSVPAPAYTAHAKLVQLASKQFFHPRYWLDVHPGQPYSAMDGIDLATVLRDLNLISKDPNLATQRFYIKSWSLEEELCMAVEQDGGLDSTSLAQLAMATSPDGLSVEHGPDSTRQDIAPPEPLTEQQETCDKHEEELEKCTRLELLMSECQPPTSAGSVLGCLVRLSALSMARQQAVRREAITAQVTGRTPTLTCSDHPDLSALPIPDSLTFDLSKKWQVRLEEVQSELCTAGRDWFQEQFPVTWREPTLVENQNNVKIKFFMLEDFEEHRAESDEILGHVMYLLHMHRINNFTKYSFPSIYSHQCMMSIFLQCEHKFDFEPITKDSPSASHIRYHMKILMQNHYQFIKAHHKNKFRNDTTDEVQQTSKSKEKSMVDLAVCVAVAPLRYESLFSTFRVMNRIFKLEDAAEPYLASLLDWACCFPEPSHELHRLAIAAVDRYVIGIWQLVDICSYDTLMLYNRKGGRQLDRVLSAQRDTQSILNISVTASLILHQEDPSSRNTVDIMLALCAVMNPKFSDLISRYFYNVTAPQINPDYKVPALHVMPKNFASDIREQFVMSLELLHKMGCSLPTRALLAAVEVISESYFSSRRICKFFIAIADPFSMYGDSLTIATALSLVQVRDGRQPCRDWNKLMQHLLGKHIPPGVQHAPKRTKKLCSPVPKTTQQQQQPTATTVPLPPPPKVLPKFSIEVEMKHENGECLGCKVPLKRGEIILACEWCESRAPAFPEPAYFCSEVCRVESIKEHQEQHLEFELGLGCWVTRNIPMDCVKCLGCGCLSAEGGETLFLVCEWCVSRIPAFPEPAYFCSEVCQSQVSKEHKEEHFEFELGLGRWFTP